MIVKVSLRLHMNNLRIVSIYDNYDNIHYNSIVIAGHIFGYIMLQYFISSKITTTVIKS